MGIEAIEGRGTVVLRIDNLPLAVERVQRPMVHYGPLDAAALAGMREQRRMPFPWRMCLLVELIQRPALPQAGLDPESLAVMIDSDGIGPVGLDLYQIGPRIGRCIDQRQRIVDSPSVVAGQLGDE